MAKFILEKIRKVDDGVYETTVVHNKFFSKTRHTRSMFCRSPILKSAYIWVDNTYIKAWMLKSIIHSYKSELDSGVEIDFTKRDSPLPVFD